MPIDKMPSVEDILALHEDCSKRYAESGLFDQFKEDELFYEGNYKERLHLPKQFSDEAIVLPTGRDIIDSCTDHTDISNIRVWVSRKGESKKAEEEKETLRKFALGVIYRNCVEAPISPIRVGSKHYWMHGTTTFKSVWDADRWMDKPDREDGEDDNTYAARIDEWRAEYHDSIPIVIQAVNPSNIMLDLYYDGGMFIFETREELCFNVKGRFGKWTNPKSKKITDKVEHISFWTKQFRCEFYDKEPVLNTPTGVAAHSYGSMPYTTIDSGLGNLSTTNDLKQRYVGVLRYVKDLLISESRDYSIADIILKKNAWPWGYLKGPGAKGVTELFQDFGEYNALPDGVEIVDMVPKLPPDALLTWLTVSANYLASHGAPNVTRGLGEAGVRSGSDRRLILAEASTRYNYSNEAFKFGIAKVLSKCARIMKNVIPGDLSVWARTPTDEFDIEIKKEKMKEPFTFYVEFSAISEEDEYRRHDDLERLVKSGLVPIPWARKQMSNVDPQAMELEEQVELLKADPAVQQIIGQYLASKVLEAVSKRSMAEAVENPPPALPPNLQEGMFGGAPQEPGRRMATPIPAVPPIGSAEQLQNQMAGLRSSVSMTEQGQGGGGNR